MSAADFLQGLTLDTGWKVTRHLKRNPNGTGGTFSQSYEVKRDGRMGFLKAFDFAAAFEPGIDTVAAVQSLVQAYNHEKDVLEHCGQKKLSNVVVAVENGSIQVPNFGQIEGRVFYLIFEMADGDVRVQMDVSKNFDSLWCMIALKDVSLGLHQVHKEMIAHQDAKPSNVLCYGNKKFKVSDFGRSSRRGYVAQHDTFTIAGDRTYAPPELIYGHVHTDFIPRRMGCDLYMLGNLACFLFSGVNITALLLSKIDAQHRPQSWGGTYEEVLPYLQNKFSEVVDEVAPLMDELIRDEMSALIVELCNPDLSARGHKRGIGTANQYSLERYVSQLDLIAKRLVVKRKVKGQAAA